jgi:hypothetical protein
MGAAHAADVKYDYDKTADVSTWKSWAWKQPEPPATGSIAEGRIRRALEEGFAAKGYTNIEGSTADFLVDYHAAVGRELRVDEGWGFPGRRDLRVNSYAKGVLIVDVFDGRTGRLVWRGSVSDALASDPAKADKKTEKAVTKLLKKFPPDGS